MAKKKSEVSPVDEERFQNLGTRPKPPQEARGEWTDIIFVLDKSGSMGSLKQTAIDGFNKFLAEQQAQPGWATFSLVLFNTTYEMPYRGVPIKEVEPLTPLTYGPEGGTALLDALGTAITATKQAIDGMAKEDRPAKVLFVILTDGEENSSTQYSLKQVQTMIKAQQECGWPFLYLAADAAAFAAGATLNIDAATRFQYKGSQRGTEAAYLAMSSVTSNLRSSKGLEPMGVVRSMSTDVSKMLNVDDDDAEKAGVFKGLLNGFMAKNKKRGK